VLDPPNVSSQIPSPYLADIGEGADDAFPLSLMAEKLHPRTFSGLVDVAAPTFRNHRKRLTVRFIRRGERIRIIGAGY
jgi:hypothetical protein